MYGFELRQVAISGGNGPRAPIFAAGGNDMFGAPARGSFLGQTTDQEWYSTAKYEVSKFDSYVDRLRKVANKQIREDLAGRFVGSAGDRDSGVYRRNTVQDDISEAESYTPVNYLIFGKDSVRRRVGKLGDINHDFRKALENAEKTWGILPEPQVIERIVEVQMPGAPQMPGWVFPVLGVGAAVGLAALLGVFK